MVFIIDANFLYDYAHSLVCSGTDDQAGFLRQVFDNEDSLKKGSISGIVAKKAFEQLVESTAHADNLKAHTFANQLTQAEFVEVGCKIFS